MTTRTVLASGLAIALGSMSAQALEVGLEINFLKPANQDVVLGTNYFDTGANDILKPDTDVGFKLHAQDGSWRASWLSLKSKTSTSVTDRDFDFYSSIDHPDDDYGSYDTLSASGKIELNELGFDYLIPLATASSTSVMLTAGLRYVMFESTLSANYDDGGQEIDRKADNDLYGLRVGLEASRELGPVTVDAVFGLGLAAGKSKFRQTETYSDWQRQLSFNSTSTAVDAQVRVTYPLLDTAKVWLGYEFLQYSDVATIQVFYDDVAEGANLQQGIDAGFHGFKLGFAWAF
jgi:hypothetical protein